jgi:nitrogen-specific signal transduction histidine kinase/CheY-like chemotaxis protein
MIGKDVTDLKATDEQLRQAQKLSAIERLAASVAHDFNNLLTVILGYASGLLDKLKPSDLGYINLSEIRNAAEKGGDLSRRLLAFSRRQNLRPRIIKLNTLVEEIGQTLATVVGPGVQFVMNLKADSGFVRADPGHFHQVLLNLAMNARDAMPDGGTLTIATFNVEIASAPAHASGIRPGSYVQLTVADNGLGMKDEVREHLFEPYFTTKQIGNGTGLGLSAVYGIVKQSGGHILVDTKFGRGTAFRIYLPRIEAEPVSAEAAEIRERPRGAETILLVGNGEDVRTLITNVLTDLGYTVLQADGPKRAIELNREQSGAIHLLVADAAIPELPVDELVELVRTFRPQIKILFISASDETDVPKPQPGFGYLQMPFTPLALALKVREILDQV